jgi:hypothetical protein
LGVVLVGSIYFKPIPSNSLCLPQKLSPTIICT